MKKNRKAARHPGIYIKDMLDKTGTKQQDLAYMLGLSHQTICDLIHFRRGLSFEMCFRLPHIFGGTVDDWWNIQQRYATGQTPRLTVVADTQARVRTVRVRNGGKRVKSA